MLTFSISGSQIYHACWGLGGAGVLGHVPGAAEGADDEAEVEVGEFDAELGSDVFRVEEDVPEEAFEDLERVDGEGELGAGVVAACDDCLPHAFRCVCRVEDVNETFRVVGGGKSFESNCCGGRHDEDEEVGHEVHVGGRTESQNGCLWLSADGPGV